MNKKYILIAIIIGSVLLSVLDSCRKTDINNVFVVDSANCIGCKKCLPVCPVNAISLKNGKAVINSSQCIGCARCAKLCPPKVIVRGEVPVDPVQLEIYKVKSSACTGCYACMSVCFYGAISVVEGVAVIDTEKCVKCGECIKVCDYKAISIEKVEAAN